MFGPGMYRDVAFGEDDHACDAGVVWKAVEMGRQDGGARGFGGAAQDFFKLFSVVAVAAAAMVDQEMGSGHEI